MKAPILALLLASSALALDWQPIPLSANEGPYSIAAWKVDWPHCEFEDGIQEDRVSLVKADGTPWLRVAYAPGQIGPDKGGCGWRWPFLNKKKSTPKPRAELRYTVLFEDGFDFVKGGKMPGLCGGPKTITGGDACTGLEGWSARLMWRKEGRGQAYVYHVNQPSKYGDEFDFPEDFRFPTGMPVQVHMALTINTVGQRDGTLRVWVALPQQKQRLMVEKTDMEWTKTVDIGVDSILFNTFHGGSDASWAPAKPCAARFGEICFLR
jgi:hypothetical protein